MSLKRYRYTCKERDEESGQYYHGARYYAPWLGRWVSCDPAGMVDEVNIYLYAMNYPINLSDSTGTTCDPSITTCPELMKNWSYGTPVPNRSDVGENVQRDHPIQVQLRKEERGGRYNRNTSAAASKQTVLVETGRGYFHTEVGKLQADITARVRAGIITTQSELIEATRNAYALAAQTTGTQVDPQALDRAIVSNLATLSETSSQTHSELIAQGATTADFDAYISSAEHSFVDPSPPPPLDPGSEHARASGVTTSSDGLINKSVQPTNSLPEPEEYEASAVANLIVLGIAGYLVAAPVLAYVEGAALEAGEEGLRVRIGQEIRVQLEEEVRKRIVEDVVQEIKEPVVEELKRKFIQR